MFKATLAQVEAESVQILGEALSWNRLGVVLFGRSLRGGIAARDDFARFRAIVLEAAISGSQYLS